VSVAGFVATGCSSSPLSQPAKAARHTSPIDAKVLTAAEYGNAI
jgi:hypothetical protein